MVSLCSAMEKSALVVTKNGLFTGFVIAPSGVRRIKNGVEIVGWAFRIEMYRRRYSRRHKK